MNENTKKDTETWMTVLMTIIVLGLILVMTTILITQRVMKRDKEECSDETVVYDVSAVACSWKSQSKGDVEMRIEEQLDEGKIIKVL